VGRWWVNAMCCALVGWASTPPDHAILVDVKGWQAKGDESAGECMSALLDSGIT